ncbi:RHS repeat domain-containing protein [Sphingosinicella terrae]|uniref:RHS repeat domain-containing protein n=1 Tax=Sphingosinicella terrae TaxID=2172047 RepID=UPI000E0DEE62|nr:RHS repeat domain-containing protein [Sphingosinicella terrae]
MKPLEKCLLALAAASITAAALAEEIITYRYDARGRLVKVERAGDVNAGVNTSYTYDKADNRTNKTTTGAP